MGSNYDLGFVGSSYDFWVVGFRISVYDPILAPLRSTSAEYRTPRSKNGAKLTFQEKQY